MVLNLIAAGILGASIPLLLRAMGRDPAQSSSIFLTTLTDVIGFGSFLGLGSVLLRYSG
jgi:magnesium transporter